MKRNLVSHMDNILKTKCDEVPYGDKVVFQDLVDTFKKGRMLGLSAPQIGIPYQCSICAFSEGVTIVINPTIEKIGVEIISTERCLSFPNIVCKVKRSAEVKLTFFNEKWEKCEMLLTGLDACIAQHEYDHLQGITMLQVAFDKKFKRGR